jgi:hypothetical protein
MAGRRSRQSPQASRGYLLLGLRRAQSEADNLRKPVEGICYWACDALNQTPHPLRLDEQNLRDADEAWVPVLTPDGPGILVWFNSD